MFEIRAMQPNEVAVAVEWAAREGWNPGASDAQLYYGVDPAGFLVGVLGEEPVATISAVRYGERYGFLGYYIVAPEHRGRGYGIAMWRRAMAHLRGRNVGLDGVPAQVANYARSGFALDHGNWIARGSGGGSDPGTTLAIDAATIDAVLAYDRGCVAVPRDAFVRAWCAQPGAIGRCVADASGTVRGYGVVRPCREGLRVAPLFADDAATAHALLSALRSRAGAAPLSLLVPDANRAAEDVARAAGMELGTGTARMYTHGRPEIPLERWFGVTSFEVG